MSDIRITLSSFNIRAARERLVWAALDHTKGNKVEAAKLLGIDRASLYYYLDKQDGVKATSREGRF